MARAALKLTMRELAARAEIDKSTLVRIEAGYGAHPFTLRQLRETLEAAGVFFIDAQEGVHASGVALKWGAEIPSRQPGEGAAASGEGETGIKAAWDDIEEAADADLDALPSEEPGLNPDMAEMWQADPELWARLSQGGRETLSRRMFGDCRAAAAGFFRA